MELPKSEKFEPNFLNKSQAIKLLEDIKNEPIYPMIVLAILYGMRRSEICGLQWSAIDFDGNKLLVKTTMVKQKTLVIKNKTKTESSRREYPLLPQIKELLLDVKQKQEINRAFLGKGYQESDQVFTWEDGRPITGDYLSKRFAKLKRKYGLPDIRLHDLRHTCASILLSDGKQLKDVQEWLGHSDISMTANVYGHLDDTRKKAIGNSMSELLV